MVSLKPWDWYESWERVIVSREINDGEAKTTAESTRTAEATIVSEKVSWADRARRTVLLTVRVAEKDRDSRCGS
jgi:hypothetical protein